MTRKELCEFKLREYAHRELKMEPPVKLEDIPESVIFQSTTIGICMEQLGLLKNPANQEYISGRGGIYTLSHDENGEPVIVTFRDILESMKE